MDCFLCKKTEKQKSRCSPSNVRGKEVLRGLLADPALCTGQAVTRGPGVSLATNGPSSQDQPLQTEEHRAAKPTRRAEGPARKSFELHH